jgi:hypothetical protein
MWVYVVKLRVALEWCAFAGIVVLTVGGWVIAVCLLPFLLIGQRLVAVPIARTREGSSRLTQGAPASSCAGNCLHCSKFVAWVSHTRTMHLEVIDA